MISQSLKITLKLYVARWLIRFKKLTHVNYTVDEIDQLITPHLPLTYPISVPRGEGSFTLLETKLSMPKNTSLICADVLASLDVTYMSNPIYRAHIVIYVQAKPNYDKDTKSVNLITPKITDIKLLQDEYSILKDTSSLLSLFVPSPLLSMVTGTMKTAFNLATGATTAEANSYLQLYLSGSKQKVLDYHKPRVEEIVTQLASNDDMRYTMDESDWQEKLFAEYGKEVVVEDGYLRFKF